MIAKQSSVARRLYALKRWMYRGDRPNRLARFLNWLSAAQFSSGLLSPGYAVTVEVRGRRTGRTIAFPVAVAECNGQEYLVSMLGEHANWVRNVRASEGRVTIRRRGRRAVRLEEVEPTARAPILRRYLAVAPGARPHFPVDRHAPLADFERIAGAYPVFRVVVDPGVDPARER
jgi:deazaflavin-dependent oxidoreductase (nitroreductase family)